MAEIKTIDAYIAQFEPEAQERMQKMRNIIKLAAPNAAEKISWGMPTFFQHGNVVHFAWNKNHLGFYPGASGVEHFLPKLKDYKTSKGAIQFAHNKPLPEKLIQEITAFRVAENEADFAKTKK